MDTGSDIAVTDRSKQAPSDALRDAEAVRTGGDTLRQDGEAVQRAQELSLRCLKPPAEVPGYTILRGLGEGAYGSVWLAREQNTGKHVSIKFYTHRRGLDWSLLNREVEKLAVLYTSRHIVGLLDVGWDSDPPYYIMEYLENGSLAGLLADGPLSPHEAVRIATAVLQALVHAHGSGILHCDLKPANVLLDSDYEPRICDFGQSRLTDEQEPALGTLFYMAPEQADLKAVPDARWDVYALGAILYHMLCGEPPYRTRENEIQIQSAGTLEARLAAYRQVLLHSPRPSKHRKMPGVDKRLADIVDRCLRIDPRNRYANAQAVLGMLAARERHRARRPLIALGIVVPMLLLAAMLPIARKAMHSVEQTARYNLTERALERNALSVRILARSLERKLEDRETELEEVAADLNLREALEEAASLGWTDRTRLNEVLDGRKERLDAKYRGQDRELDTSWFLTDAQGVQRWRHPFDPKTFDQKFSHRDYFHGQNKQYDPDNVPHDIQPIVAPHISTPFQSGATHQFMVAVSVPVWSSDDGGEQRVIGVLARTAHLGELLEEYERIVRDGEANRVVALVDIRTGLLLHHPWITSENERIQALPADSQAALREKKEFAHMLNRLTLDDHLLAGLRELSAGDRRHMPTIRNGHYTDPVGLIGPPRYSGDCMAAMSPVGEMEWAAIVQEKRHQALRPVDEMRTDFLRYAAAGLSACLAVIAASWAFVWQAMRRRGRRSSLSNGVYRLTGGGTTTSE